MKECLQSSDKMAEEDEKEETLTETEAVETTASSDSSESSETSEKNKSEEEDAKTGLIQSLFSAGNKLLTLPNSQTISIGDDTRRLLALF